MANGYKVSLQTEQIRQNFLVQSIRYICGNWCRIRLSAGNATQRWLKHSESKCFSATQALLNWVSCFGQPASPSTLNSPWLAKTIKARGYSGREWQTEKQQQGKSNKEQPFLKWSWKDTSEEIRGGDQWVFTDFILLCWADYGAGN